MANRLKRISYIFLLSIFILTTSLTAFGQETQSGKWKAKISGKDSQKIQISFHQANISTNHKDKHKNHGSSSSFAMADLQGLSITQVNNSDSNVTFSLIREAGTIQMIGSFDNGKGSGAWTFTPDSNFVSTMGTLGFDNISTKELFASAMLNVKSKTVTELRNSGINNLKFDDVFTATIFKIDSSYISEMSTAGFEKLDMEDLVQARIFKIDAKYASEVLAQGFATQSIEDLVQFKIFKITPEFLTQMKSEGLRNLTPGNLVQLRIFKIDSEFIQSVRANGNSSPSVGELVELKIHGKVK